MNIQKISVRTPKSKSAVSRAEEQSMLHSVNASKRRHKVIYSTALPLIQTQMTTYQPTVLRIVGFLLLIFSVPGISFTQIGGDLIDKESTARIGSKYNKSKGDDYFEVLREIAGRGQQGNAGSDKFNEFSQVELLLYKAMQDEVYFRTQRDELNERKYKRASLDVWNSLISLLNDKVGKVGMPYSVAIAIIGADRRGEVQLAAKKIKDLSIASTVMVIENKSVYGTMGSTGDFQGVTALLKNNFNSWKPQSSMRFQGEFIFKRGTRSGTLINYNWILTAGHKLKLGDSLIVVKEHLLSNQQGNAYKPNTFVRKGAVKFVTWGSSTAPDFALIELNNSFAERGIQISDIKSTAIGDSLFCPSHPWGMQIIVDDSGFVIAPPNQKWADNPFYHFANIDVNQGSSGSPVFKKIITTSQTGKDTTLVPVGIVVGSGGHEDFDFNSISKTFDWTGVPIDHTFGARILRLESIQDTLTYIINGGPPPNVPTIPSPQSSFDLSHYKVEIHGEELWAISNDDPTNPKRYQLNRPLLCTIQGRQIQIEQTKTLEHAYLGTIRRAPIHEEFWPTSVLTEPTEYLKFRYDFKHSEIPTIGLPIGQYSVLDGIGSGDIVDILPDTKALRRTTWLCDGEPIELSLVPKVPFTSHPAPQSIRIRSVKPFVKIYTRTSLDGKTF